MKKNILYILLLLLLAGCHEEVEQQARLDVSLCLPAGEISRKANGPRRIMGDPGVTEQFDLPKYAYIFVMRYEAGDTWSVWRREERILAADKWERTRYNGSWLNGGDSVFRYTDNLQLALKKETPTGRVYAICSNKKLTFDPSLSSIADLNGLLNLRFNTAPDSVQESLKNIYSTPYNYTSAGQYYCSFDCSSGNSFSVDLLLYHVAAKVDIKWNVVDSMRINKDDPSAAVRLTYMEARRLFNGYAYCFKPMKNELGSLPGAGYGYTIADIVTPTDEGLWWEGRDYFYTILYTVDGDEDYFPLQMKMGTNGTKETAKYEPTLKLEIDTSAVFVPWLRANFNLSKPLEDKTTDIIVESK